MLHRDTTFISYSRTDLDVVLRLALALREAGVAVWLDKLDIQPGEEWDEAIASALAECSRLLIVLSAKSVASDNVLDEVSFALSKKKAVVPLLLEDCEVPYRLNRVQYVDFRQGYEHGFAELLVALKGSAETQDAARVAAVQKATLTQADALRPSARWRNATLLSGVIALLVVAWQGLNRGQSSTASAPPELGPALKQPDGDQASAGVAAPVAVAASKPAVAAAQAKVPFKEAYRRAMLKYLDQAASGFKALGAEEFVDWSPSVSLPNARRCRGSGYPGSPVIECVMYRTESELEALDKFEELMELTEAVLPGSKGERMNLFWGSVSKPEYSARVMFNVNRSAGHYDVVVSVRPKR